MPPRSDEDDIGSLERAREALYQHPTAPEQWRTPLPASREPSLRHEWEEKSAPMLQRGRRHVRLATMFFGFSVLFFIVAVGITGYFFYFGGNSVSTDKVTVDIQGPSTIAGGDTVPLSLTITNKNPVALDNATIEIDFPDGTRSATDVTTAYPRYVENLGTLASGAVVTRSVRAIVFGGAGQTLTLPVSLSYGTDSSNAIFSKKSSYALAISSTPLSISVDSLAETTSGQPLTFTLSVRSNATVPISNVVIDPSFPFGFSLTSSSVPFTNSSFSIGTLAPGATEQVTLTGVLTGQDNDLRVFHFSVGTAQSAQDPTLAITYMTQDASITIAQPFITADLTLNGSDMSAGNVTVAPGSLQTVSLSYSNTLSTTITNASITVAITGSAINYDSINTTNGFYNSADHTIVFSKDTDPALASLAPGASGFGTFTFSTLPTGSPSPSASFTVSVSGTRVGQTNVPEQVTTSVTDSIKVFTTVVFSSVSSRILGSFVQTGPIPPRANQATTYAIVWNAQNQGSAVAGGTVTTTLPSYVSYIGATTGVGTFSYDSSSRTVTWNTGDLAQGASAQGIFQVSVTPSTSQRGGPIPLTDGPTFSGYDRFAGVQISASASAATTDTPGDPGYVTANGIVQ